MMNEDKKQKTKILDRDDFFNGNIIKKLFDVTEGCLQHNTLLSIAYLNVGVHITLRLCQRCYSKYYKF